MIPKPSEWDTPRSKSAKVHLIISPWANFVGTLRVWVGSEPQKPQWAWVSLSNWEGALPFSADPRVLKWRSTRSSSGLEKTDQTVPRSFPTKTRTPYAPTARWTVSAPPEPSDHSAAPASAALPAPSRFGPPGKIPEQTYS